MTKTNALRILETAGVSYSLMEYQVDENDPVSYTHLDVYKRQG